MLADYPDSPTARHALALLAAHGQRELDNALKYAQAAVTADPSSITYRETLAEVHFRRGERADALKLMQKLRDEQPRNTLYLRQLARYRDAKPNAPWPYTDE
jgi:predicted Zn-dependent protease